MKSRTIETLERRLEERTHQLAFANQTRTQLLAASHDLRQPMHALGLFAAQLRGLVREVEQKQIVDHIDSALSALSQRFSELIGLSKLDAAASGLDERDKVAASTIPVYASHDRTNGKLIVVIDDDPLVLDSTCGLLRSWGCSVVGTSGSSVLPCPLDRQRPPDLIISDFRLADGKTGIESIAELRSAHQPQHFLLPLRQAEIGRRDSGPIGGDRLFVALPGPGVIASKEFRRDLLAR